MNVPAAVDDVDVAARDAKRLSAKRAIRKKPSTASHSMHPSIPTMGLASPNQVKLLTKPRRMKGNANRVGLADAVAASADERRNQ